MLLLLLLLLLFCFREGSENFVGERYQIRMGIWILRIVVLGDGNVVLVCSLVPQVRDCIQTRGCV